MLQKSLAKALVKQAATDIPGSAFWVIIAGHLIDSIDTQEKEIDKLKNLVTAQVTNPLRTGKDYLDDAKHAPDLDAQQEYVKKAQDQFRKVSTFTDSELPDTPLLPIESMIWVGVCFDLNADHRNALRWYQKAHESIMAYESKLLETSKKKKAKKKLENIRPKISEIIRTSAELLHDTDPTLETATVIIEGQELLGHKSGVNYLTFFPDNLKLATGSDDNQIKVWDVETGAEIRSFDEHSAKINDLAISPDGSFLASASDDNTAKWWNLEQDSGFFTFTGHGNNSVNCIDFSVDSKLLASGSNDQTIKIWEVRSGKILHTLTGHSNNVTSIQFSPSGPFLASGSEDNTVKLWHIETGAELITLSGHKDTIRQVAFSSDGAFIATASNDKTVKGWNVETGEEIFGLVGHENKVTSVVFSPDNSLLISGSDDETVKLWNVAARTEARLYCVGDEPTIEHTSHVRTVAYSPNGRLMASGSKDKTIKLWSLLGRVQYQQGSMKRLT